MSRNAKQSPIMRRILRPGFLEVFAAVAILNSAIRVGDISLPWAIVAAFVTAAIIGLIRDLVGRFGISPGRLRTPARYDRRSVHERHPETAGSEVVYKVSDDVAVWLDSSGGPICIKTSDKYGDPVELTEDDAEELAAILINLAKKSRG
jgi:hypothetical protein